MKQYPFYKALAHEDDPLESHLKRVALAALDSTRGARPEVGIIACLAGLCHDLGKATEYFQVNRLVNKQKNEHTAHSRPGAALAFWYVGRFDLPLWVRLGVFLAVLRHHGSIKQTGWAEDFLNIRQDLHERDCVLVDQLNCLETGSIIPWLDMQTALLLPDLPRPANALVSANIVEELGNCFAGVRSGQAKKAFCELEQVAGFLAGFGALLSNDRVDTAMGATISREHLPQNMVEEYSAAFLNPASSSMNPLRKEIKTQVEKTWLANVDRSLFTLTAPTGSGKTLAVLNAAVKARNELFARHGHQARIIYCLPFTSIIDQNHEVFKKVVSHAGLGNREDILLKHHHLVEPRFRTVDEEHEPDGAGQLLTETWQSEIVVTTFYQLMHSLLSVRASQLKRAGQLCGAIVLMDEVQALPVSYWQAVKEIFKAAARQLGTRFVLLTATRPLIFDPADSSVVELLPQHKKHFAAMSRVALRCEPGNHSLDEMADTILADVDSGATTAMVVLNRRASVGKLFYLLEGRLPSGVRLVALSTNFTPRDRRARIRLVRTLLKAKIPCLLVTTQLVEAGVDLSFPVVHRELAPLDSIIQACGRANRHGEGVAGKVFVWRIADDKGCPTWRKVYDAPLIEATEAVLGMNKNTDCLEYPESAFLDMGLKYFAACMKRQQQADLGELLVKGDLETLIEKFRLIDEGPPTTSCFICKDNIDRALWEEYEHIHSKQNLAPLEKKARFGKIKRAFYERVIQVYGKMGDSQAPIVLIDDYPNSYSPQIGFAPSKIVQESTSFF